MDLDRKQGVLELAENHPSIEVTLLTIANKIGVDIIQDEVYKVFLAPAAVAAVFLQWRSVS
jgi:hypothetical protein